MKDVAVEVGQRLGLVAFRDDGQPEPELAEAHRFGLEIDAEEVALHDVLAIASAEALEHAQGREEERAGAAGRIEHGNVVDARQQRERQARGVAGQARPQRHARLRIAVAQHFDDRPLRQNVDDRPRRIKAAALGPLVRGHQRLEDFAEHLRIDVRAGGVALVDREGELLEDVVDDAA